VSRLAPLLRVPPLSADRLLWAVRVRWLVIAGFLLLAVAAHTLGLFPSIAPVLQVGIVGGALNGVNEWCVRRRRYMFQVAALQIPLDHLFTTYLVVNTGGVQSPFLMLYVLQVLATAMLVDVRLAAGSALLAIVLWVSGISLQAAGYIGTPPLFVRGTTSMAVYHGAWAAFLFYCLALLVFLGGYLGERLRSSERDLEEKNRHLQDALASLRAAHQELTAAHERLKQTEAHLVQSEKMRGLGQLVAGVAHELNNPISFVSANVEHLRTYVDRLRRALDAYGAVMCTAEEKSRLDAMRRDLRLEQVLADLPTLLADCEEGARRTKRIVTDLRTFSRSDERELWQRSDVHRGIDSTLGLLAHRLDRRIAIHKEFGDVAEVECLPGQLNQVFMNLLANAADAIGAKPGNIWITTRMNVVPSSAEPTVTIAVRDDGAGMSPDVQARVFDPFFTTKQVGQGTGLGLSISYGIVTRHGGTLTVNSLPGAGSTFTIMLPVRQPTAEREQ